MLRGTSPHLPDFQGSSPIKPFYIINSELFFILLLNINKLRKIIQNNFGVLGSDRAAFEWLKIPNQTPLIFLNLWENLFVP